MATEQEDTSIVSDARLGNVDAVHTWLQNGGQNNSKKQKIMLNTAAENGQTDVCQLIIDTGRLTAENLIEALRMACYTGELSVMKLLVSNLGQRFDVTMLGNLLHYNATRGHTEVVDWLLSLSHLPAGAADTMRWAVVAASARGDLKAVTHLVNNIGPDVTEVMSYALWAACYRGRGDVVDWLMTHTSADVNACKVRGIKCGEMTSLAVAFYSGRMSIAKQLLMYESAPCDINMVSSEKHNAALHEVIWRTGWTALHKACCAGDTAAVVDLVYKCDVNTRDKDGATPLHYACMNGNVSTVRAFLSVLPDTDVTDDKGDTPASVSKTSGNSKLAKYMLNLMCASDDKTDDEPL